MVDFRRRGHILIDRGNHEIAQALPQNGPVVNFGKQASRAGEWYTVFPVAAGFYASGLVTHDKKLIETGALSLEALVSADVVTIGLKAAVRQERPNQGDHGGHFEKGGSSFPSGHSTQAWALAAVLADNMEITNGFRTSAMGTRL